MSQRAITRSANQKKPAKKKPRTKRLARILPTSRTRGKPKRRKPMVKDDDDKKKRDEENKKRGGKEPDPMATPPDTVSAPSQLPSEQEPEKK